MALDDLSGSETDVLDGIRDYTLEELIEVYNEEIVRRAVGYMQSLEEADEEYRKSGSADEFKDKWSEAFGVEPSEQVDDAATEWAGKMEEEGLGIGGESNE